MRVALTHTPDQLPKGITPSLLRRVARESCLLALPDLFAPSERGIKLDVAFVSQSEIAALNAQYRAKPHATDVLSFGNFPSRAAIKRASTKVLDLGTLVLSLPFIRRAAREDGVSWEREFVFVFSHGVLHLLGFDHEERMFAIQDQVTDQCSPKHKKY